jgi:hypothetical protein
MGEEGGEVFQQAKKIKTRAKMQQRGGRRWRRLQGEGRAKDEERNKYYR